MPGRSSSIAGTNPSAFRVCLVYAADAPAEDSPLTFDQSNHRSFRQVGRRIPPRPFPLLTFPDFFTTGHSKTLLASSEFPLQPSRPLLPFFSSPRERRPYSGFFLSGSYGIALFSASACSSFGSELGAMCPPPPVPDLVCSPLPFWCIFRHLEVATHSPLFVDPVIDSG